MLDSCLRQATHLADSAVFSAMFSRYSNYCWSYWASNKYLASWIYQLIIPFYSWPNRASKGSLAGPIGPARYLLLTRQGQQQIEDLETLTENVAESAKCVPCLRQESSNTLYPHTTCVLCEYQDIIEMLDKDLTTCLFQIS